MSQYTVGVIVGSVSRDSINRRFAEALAFLAPAADLEFISIAIAELPFYGTHYDTDYPQIGLDFKAAIETVDGLLFVTPEYNRSIPAVLKNAIDWATRPAGQGVLRDVPAGVIGTSRGVISTAVAQSHLRSILAAQGVALGGEREAYIRFTDDLLDADGRIAIPSTEALLLAYLRGLHGLIARWV